MQTVVRMSRPRHRPLRVQEVTVLGDETKRRFEVLQVFVDAIQAGRLFDQIHPGREIGRRQPHHGLDHFDRRRLREIVDGLIDLQLLQRSLLGGERLGGGLVCAIGGEPYAMADGEDVIIGWNQVDGAFSGAVEAVLLVVADAHYNAQQAGAIMLLAAQRAENGAGFELVDLGNAVFNVIRRWDVLQFQLGFGALHFFAKSAEEDIAGSGIGGAGEG